MGNRRPQLTEAKNISSLSDITIDEKVTVSPVAPTVFNASPATQWEFPRARNN